MRLYLINPKFPDTFWGFGHVKDLGGTRYATANLGLPTVAALVPPQISVQLCDENIEAIDFDRDADLIGITGFNIQSARMFEIAKAFRDRGKPVVIGGPYASLCPGECEPHADVLIVGEAERIWPRFLDDFLGGRYESRYEEKEKIDMTTSPLPRWDLLKLKHYGRIPVQTTRGCPFTCEFCDVIVFLGNKVRQKSSDQVLTELDSLYPHMFRAGRDSVFFADDNFIGNKVHAKRISRALIDWNQSLKRPVRFSTQVTINMARDRELMELMAAANFHSVFVGIETPKKANLLEAGKRQNTVGDLIQDVKTIQSHGIFVWAGMIVGFDNDDPSVFREQLDFINDANIPISMTGMLNAPANTPLWHRLQKEGRLIPGHQYEDQADTNIIPKKMSVEELRSGYIHLLNDLYSYENYGKRLQGTLDAIQAKPPRHAKGFSLRHALFNFKRLSKMLRYYLMTADKERRHYFVSMVRHLTKSNPHYLKEGLWHLAVHKHFHEYSQALQKSWEVKAA